MKNMHNEPMWLYENLHAVKDICFQYKIKINVRAGIIGDPIIAPSISLIF